MVDISSCLRTKLSFRSPTRPCLSGNISSISLSPLNGDAREELILIMKLLLECGLSLASLLSLVAPIAALPVGEQFHRSTLVKNQVIPQQNDSNSSNPNILRGVNIGGWLILEKWMDGEVFATAKSDPDQSKQDPPDQYNFDQTSVANSSLASHWQDWFKASDMDTLKGWGFNA